jgi:hypothetical protein
MKPFVLFLLLIGCGILFGMVSRPVEALATFGRKLPSFPARFLLKRQLVPAGLQTAGSIRSSSRHPLPGNTWRQAAQF